MSATRPAEDAAAGDGGVARGGAMGTWVYALVSAARAPALRRLPAGPPDLGPPRLLEVAPGLWLVVADAPMETYGADAIEARLQDLDWLSDRALGHEAVVAHLCAGATVVPMKLFTIFNEDARAIADIRARRRALEGVLERVGGRDEWGLRVHVDPAAAARAALAEAEAEKDEAPSGTAFLRRKQRVQSASRSARSRAAERAEALLAVLSDRADAVRRHTVPAEGGGRLVLDAAFLVGRRRKAGFEAEVRRATAELEALGCKVSLTGPWPAYNFVEPAP
jgi:hypothetical protein